LSDADGAQMDVDISVVIERTADAIVWSSAAFFMDFAGSAGTYIAESDDRASV